MIARNILQRLDGDTWTDLGWLETPEDVGEAISIVYGSRGRYRIVAVYALT